jgi:hypothetical protein
MTVEHSTDLRSYLSTIEEHSTDFRNYLSVTVEHSTDFRSYLGVTVARALMRATFALVRTRGQASPGVGTWHAESVRHRHRDFGLKDSKLAHSSKLAHQE